MNRQEALWAGDFGDAYIKRQKPNLLANRVFFRRALQAAGLQHFKAIEFGANVGDNLLALRRMFPHAWLAGVEINETAFQKLRAVADEAYLGSISDFEPMPAWDLAFTKGVLIHVDPKNLADVLRNIYDSSRQWILLAEYHSPRFETLEYRGQDAALWKGPYAESFMDLFPTVVVRDYGFWWKRDKYPQDNLNWWLFEK
jgi:spore coat polysaccharide biosynthesis protein SpsF